MFATRSPLTLFSVLSTRCPLEDREQVFREAAITLPDTTPLGLDQLDHGSVRRILRPVL